MKEKKLLSLLFTRVLSLSKRRILCLLRVSWMLEAYQMDFRIRWVFKWLQKRGIFFILFLRINYYNSLNGKDFFVFKYRGTGVWFLDKCLFNFYSYHSWNANEALYQHCKIQEYGPMVRDSDLRVGSICSYR